MGKLLAKFEQLFTPDCLHPEESVVSSPTDPLSSSSGGKASFRCGDLMGSFITRLKTSVARARAEDHASGQDEDRKRLPFDSLPDECKLKIFSYLNNCQKSVASQVSQEWHALLQTQNMWTDMDLTVVPGLHDGSTTVGSSLRHQRRHRCNSGCRDAYMSRVTSFLHYLTSINPQIQQISFTYDIYTNNNRFIDLLNKFLDTLRCADVRRARLVWDRMTALYSSDLAFEEVMSAEESQRERSRQRVFVDFFERFVKTSPNIEHLNMTFDWSPRSVESLLALTQLRSLRLGHYFTHKSVSPATISSVLAGLCNLRLLYMDVWTASGNGLLGYDICSPSLEVLDLSSCRGVYIIKLDLPSLRNLQVSRNPWCWTLSSSPAVKAEALRGSPCLYDLLCEGAPALERLNAHRLRVGWREGLYPELDDVMKRVCCCPLHYQAGEMSLEGAQSFPSGGGGGEARLTSKHHEKSNGAAILGSRAVSSGACYSA